MKIVVATLIGVLANVAMYVYLQQSPSAEVASAPSKNSPMIVVHKP